ncbi:hypothetical protein ACFQ9X_24575 [Catenulispora yoronensis]
MLDTVGVGTNAQTVYTAMQQRPRADVAALAVLAGLSEDQVREALDELVALELLRASREYDGEFVPVPLAIALPMLVRRQEEELAARQRAIADARATATRLIAEQIAPRSDTRVIPARSPPSICSAPTPSRTGWTRWWPAPPPR